jgi:hypothetical protein
MPMPFHRLLPISLKTGTNIYSRAAEAVVVLATAE